ncbi:hypothetical protein [Fusobacterium periodonticum]|uniref:Uncharacterized protein n=2 Tax=Fusobacterium periodonticum TaxID=860 RepID=A0AAD0HU44_9FUSO|nr:hypothetical protein [Fusobacterium periodonticum]AVQ25004.1 hypothetical protein C4N17_04390 [Fusobacterium periodonticum]KGE63546.1 hypothetical protein FSAG_003080 [Fusobacterium periodonticum 2_1_31]
MEIFKKFGLILILVLEIIAFLKCIKKPKKTSKENLIENEKEDFENKKEDLENKNLSIFELIEISIQPNGELPEDFKLPPKDPNGVPWADGALDGVCIYHLVENEEDIEPLKNIVFQISEGKFEEAQNNLENLDFFMISRRDSLLNWIIQEQKQINIDNLCEFTISQLSTSKNIEVIKFCLCVLEIIKLETEKDTIEKVKILALSDEFTLYCLNILKNLKNSNEEIFEIAKKVKGWGRIYSIKYLKVTNDEIKEWILEEGCHNYIIPAYTAYTCAKKINLVEILNEDKISSKKFNDISYLMNALLDEEAITGISNLEDRELLIERYLEKAKTLASAEEDYYAIITLKEYIKNNKEINNELIKICDEILNSEKTRNIVKELLKEGYGYNIAKYLGIDIDKYILEYLQDNPLKNPYIVFNISERENMEKLVSLIEKKLTLEKLEGVPTDKFYSKNEKNKEYIFLDTIIKKLGNFGRTEGKFVVSVYPVDPTASMDEPENYIGIGENLIICALNSPYVDIRYNAVNTLESWKEKGYILSNEIIENIKKLEKLEVDEELKIKLNELLK